VEAGRSVGRSFANSLKDIMVMSGYGEENQDQKYRLEMAFTGFGDEMNSRDKRKRNKSRVCF
jgi:hypothetical protein